jgi:hypothetical protein
LGDFNLLIKSIQMGFDLKKSEIELSPECPKGGFQIS